MTQDHIKSAAVLYNNGQTCERTTLLYTLDRHGRMWLATEHDDEPAQLTRQGTTVIQGWGDLDGPAAIWAIGQRGEWLIPLATERKLLDA